MEISVSNAVNAQNRCRSWEHPGAVPLPSWRSQRKVPEGNLWPGSRRMTRSSSGHLRQRAAHVKANGQQSFPEMYGRLFKISKSSLSTQLSRSCQARLAQGCHLVQMCHCSPRQPCDNATNCLGDVFCLRECYEVLPARPCAVRKQGTRNS